MILRKLPNGLNFEVLNETTLERRIVHHNRRCPFKSSSDGDHKADSFDSRSKDFEAHTLYRFL